MGTTSQDPLHQLTLLKVRVHVSSKDEAIEIILLG